MATKNSILSSDKPKSQSSNLANSHPPKTPPPQQTSVKPSSSPEEHHGKKTRLLVKFDCGFNNWITIRGEGAGLNWQAGIPLKNIGNDEWAFETDLVFVNCEFKVLINDEIYESGPNHPLICGTSTQHIPYF